MGQLKTGGGVALASLRDQGVIRGFGAGINERGMIARLLGLLDIDFFLVAMPYTLLDQAIVDDEFALCEQRNVGLIIGAVLASGILGTGARPGATYNYAPASAEIMAKTDRIETVCKRYDIPLAAAALQFPLGHPLVASVIPGALSAAHVQQNVRSLQTPIPAALWDELRALGLLHARAPVPRAAAEVAAGTAG